MERRGLRFRKAFGAAANGTIVSGVQGAVIGLGVGAGVALAVEFGADILGSEAEQLVGAVTGGLASAVFWSW
ncbi:hypothetical protein AALA79_20555 [Lachnospiraceae bacterium 64-25]